MANTYTQLYVHIIFAVKNKNNFIPEKHREETEKYMCGIISKNSCKTLAIYCNPDHTHILIGISPNITISELLKKIKANTSRWINDKKLLNGYFEWQKGYGAFTYSKSQIPSVINYILDQSEHHKKTTFRDEYIKILEKFDIEYKDKYLYDWYEE
jgi:REP element-mobilizing transposase RayT